jgi:hypothetical protein
MFEERDPAPALIRAEVGLKMTEDGGRRRPIFSGYRCNCWIGARTAGGEKAYNDAAIWFESQDRLAPGETTVARLQPTILEYWNHVDAGSVIDLCEGPRIIGKARVIELRSSSDG